MASSSPVPLVADVLKICHFLSLSAGRPRELATSVGVMAWSMSCLLAKTTRMAFFSSSSCTQQVGISLDKLQLQVYLRPHPAETKLSASHTHWHDWLFSLPSWTLPPQASPPTWLPAQTLRFPSCPCHYCPPHRSLHLCWSSNNASKVCKGKKGIQETTNPNWKTLLYASADQHTSLSLNSPFIKLLMALLFQAQWYYMWQKSRLKWNTQYIPYSKTWLSSRLIYMWTNLYLILVCPPRSHTWNLRFLYVTVSTLKPIAKDKGHFNWVKHYIQNLGISWWKKTELWILAFIL